MSKQACASCINAKPDNKDFERENEIKVDWRTYFVPKLGTVIIFAHVFGQNFRAKWH